MTIPQSTLDRLVHDYLDAVARNLVGVPEDRRRELLTDLADHIAAERADLDDPTEADVRAILDRLGDPALVAAEARILDGPSTASPAGPSPVAGLMPPPPMAPVMVMPAARPGLGTGIKVLIVVLATFTVLVLLVCVGLLGFRAASSDGSPMQVDVTPVPTAPTPS
jgi:hypothetical protein